MDDIDGPELVVIDRDGIPRPGLRPFDSERARSAGRRSADARRARAMVGRAAPDVVARELRQVAGTYERAELGPMAMAAAADLIGRVVRGDVPVRNGGEAAELLRALVDVARIEAGDATRTVAVAHLSGPALAQRLRELQVSAAVSAADDAPALAPPVTPPLA
jgi:hypothetical protein